MTKIHCRIITPEKLYREFDSDILTIETTEGQQGILPNHMPLVTNLVIGKLSSVLDGKREEYAVTGGLFYFRENKAEILTDAIESKEEIDLARAEQAKNRAENRIQHKSEDIDLRRAEIALKKALNRIRVGKL
ncbi:MULTISPECIES: ATP synthase F1 subunit epsilon [Terrabacteria group]|uniref:ATP synthase F1 subunit epsilon n=1 Tax=Bacillati TaxID=1783272 RepID=UPI001C6DF41D|nr:MULTISPECIES: ATP synthase F1 subunit epsilon [Terrabacteria group]MBW9212477.1 ATP synthase F1 subunit epsilon [Trueperella sp. zg.1013]